MKKNVLKYLLIFILFGTTSLFAQQEINKEKEIKIEEILISGEKPDQPELNVDKEQIQLVSPRDIGDIFKSITGFGVLKRGGFAMEPVFRSFKLEQLNIMFDGALTTVPACPNRMDPITTHINPNDIEKIEVVKGPYTVRYGQTMGAVINIITTKPHYSESFETHGLLDLGYESNGSAKKTSGMLTFGNKNFDLSLSGGYNDYDNYTNGSGQEIASAFTNYDYAVKLGYNITSNQRFQASWRQTFARDVLHAGLPMDTKTDDQTSITIDYSAQNLTDKIFAVNAKFYHSSVEHLMSNELRPSYKATHANTPVTSLNYGAKMEMGLNLSDNNLVYIGADYKYINKNGSRTREVYINTCTGMVFDPPKVFVDKVWQNSNTYNYGFYVENKNNISENLKLNAGLRVDINNGEILDPEEDFLNLYNGDLKTDALTNISGMLTTTYELNSMYNIQLAYGLGSRAPKITERYINHFTVGMDAYEYVGNPFLKSEKNNQLDLVFSKSAKIFSFQIDLFYSYMNDYITAVVDTTISKKFMPCMPPANAKRFINIDKATQYGFEVSAGYKFAKYFSLNGNVYYTHAQNDDFNEPLAEIPPLSSNLSLSYTGKKFFASINGRFVAEQTRVSKSFNESPSDGFSVFDMKLAYIATKYLTIEMGVNNIFDVTYYEHLSRPYKNMPEQSMFYEPGTNFLFSMKARF
jgi:iron complex outermembrane receptor protein